MDYFQINKSLGAISNSKEHFEYMPFFLFKYLLILICYIALTCQMKKNHVGK